jgi:propanediol utilization protein
MICNLINYNQQMTTIGCIAGHIHLDKNKFNMLFQKEQYAAHY